MRKPVLYIIGHSTRPIAEFLAVLEAHKIEQVVDVRRIPRSRHNPQYDQTELRHSLNTALIRYEHMPRLGGLRHARKGSPNDGWINASFRGYADHMQSKDFHPFPIPLHREAVPGGCVIASSCRSREKVVSPLGRSRQGALSAVG